MLGRPNARVIGDRWTWFIIRYAFLGISRFGEFEKSLGVAHECAATTG